MANILLLSTIYPLPGKGNHGTPVCHFFAREWVKMGYNVRVVHYQSVYPTPLYWLAKLNRDKIASKTGAVVYTKRDRGGRYDMDSVPVCRIPLFKPIPHGKYTKRAINKSIDEIADWLKSDDFTPDVIIGHFPNPQIEVVGRLKEVWPKAKGVIVMHGDVEIAMKVYGEKLLSLSKKIDIWGFRNKSIQEQFERSVLKPEKSFICYSGIPEDYITLKNTHSFSISILKVVYVGEMIERKYPIAVLDALQKAFPDGNYEMTYVGEGSLLSKVHNRIESDSLQQKVKTLGKIPRVAIKDLYDQADCMVMISRGEAYGLVYLEAMSRGCITIASRKEGFDGIIEDGVNGFLCKAGDSEELAQIMRKISGMTTEAKLRISENAIMTAKSLTDYLAAKRYIDDVIRLSK